MKKRFFCLFFLLPLLATAQVFTDVSTSLSQSQAYVGETVALTFSLQTEEKPILQPLRNVYGLKIEFQGENVSTQMTTTIVNGQRNSQTIYQYRFTYLITPEAPGEYIIPKTVVTVGGRDYETSTVKLQVREVEPHPNFRLTLTPDCGSFAYEGQEVSLTVALEIGASIDNLNIRIPFLEGMTIKSSDSNQGEGNIKINDTYVSAHRENQNSERAIFVSQINFLLPLSSDNSSRIFSFEKATASFRAVTSTRESVDFFGRLVEEPQYSTVVIPAQSGQLEIRPLPQPQPENFSGIVGVPQITTEADLQEAYVGDPITYKVIVSGLKTPPTELAPLHKMEKFLQGFRIPQRHSPPLLEEGKAVFVTTIRPLSETVREIPSYECCYFNPQKGAYEIAEGKALPLKVKPSQQVTEEQIEEFSFAAVESKEIDLTPLTNQISSLKEPEELLKIEKRFPFKPLFWVIYILLLLLPLIIVISSLIYKYYKSLPPTLALQRKEFFSKIDKIFHLPPEDQWLSLLELFNQYDFLVEEEVALKEVKKEVEEQLFSQKDRKKGDIDILLRHLENLR